MVIGVARKYTFDANESQIKFAHFFLLLFFSKLICLYFSPCHLHTASTMKTITQLLHHHRIFNVTVIDSLHLAHIYHYNDDILGTSEINPHSTCHFASNRCVCFILHPKIEQINNSNAIVCYHFGLFATIFTCNCVKR